MSQVARIMKINNLETIPRRHRSRPRSARSRRLSWPDNSNKVSQKLDKSPASAAVVNKILAVGSVLSLDVITEGVETVEQEIQLTQRG